jgi:hypothetical protein
MRGVFVLCRKDRLMKLPFRIIDPNRGLTVHDHRYHGFKHT